MNFGLKASGKSVLRSLVLSICMIAAAYISLDVIRYLFGEDYRFWNNVFGVMKVEYWWVALKFAVVIFLPQLAINVLTNYTVRTDIPRMERHPLYGFVWHGRRMAVLHAECHHAPFGRRGALQLELCFCAGPDAPAHHLFIKKAL